MANTFAPKLPREFGISGEPRRAEVPQSEIQRPDGAAGNPDPQFAKGARLASIVPNAIWNGTGRPKFES